MCITQIYIYIHIYIHHISSMCLLCLPCVYVCIYMCARVCPKESTVFVLLHLAVFLVLGVYPTGCEKRSILAGSTGVARLFLFKVWLKVSYAKKNPAIKFTVLGETSKHIHFPLPFFVLLVSLNVVERISRFHCHISFSGNRQNISFPEIAIFHCHIYIYFIAI